MNYIKSLVSTFSSLFPTINLVFFLAKLIPFMFSVALFRRVLLDTLRQAIDSNNYHETYVLVFVLALIVICVCYVMEKTRSLTQDRNYSHSTFIKSCAIGILLLCLIITSWYYLPAFLTSALTLGSILASIFEPKITGHGLLLPTADVVVGSVGATNLDKPFGPNVMTMQNETGAGNGSDSTAQSNHRPTLRHSYFLPGNNTPRYVAFTNNNVIFPTNDPEELRVNALNNECNAQDMISAQRIVNFVKILIQDGKVPVEKTAKLDNIISRQTPMADQALIKTELDSYPANSKKRRLLRLELQTAHSNDKTVYKDQVEEEYNDIITKHYPNYKNDAGVIALRNIIRQEHDA